MDLLLKFLRLEWWVYIIVVVVFFTVSLFLNYVVKKINEVRLEERIAEIQNKVSNSQLIHVQRRAESRLLSRVPLDIVLEQSNPPTVKGISLVFDKNDNSNDRNKDHIDITNFPNSKCLTAADVSDLSAESDLTENPSDNDVVPPAFLGKIYKELCVIERSKSLSNADKDNVRLEINKIDSKRQESKSAPSVKKLLDNHNNEDFKKWSLKLLGEDIISDPKSTTSTDLVKE